MTEINEKSIKIYCDAIEMSEIYSYDEFTQCRMTEIINILQKYDKLVAWENSIEINIDEIYVYIYLNANLNELIESGLSYLDVKHIGRLGLNLLVHESIVFLYYIIKVNN